MMVQLIKASMMDRDKKRRQSFDESRFRNDFKLLNEGGMLE